MHYLRFVPGPARRILLRRASIYLLGAAMTWAQTGVSQFAPRINGTSARTIDAPLWSEIEALHPFTHDAHIPADVNVASIRLAGIKAVKVATTAKLTENQEYCRGEESFRDPGGSYFCPEVEPITFGPAYQVTYSYVGSPLPSDEHGDRNFTFSVYFRPEEIDAQQRQALLQRNSRGRAEYFVLTTTRATVERRAVNQSASTFCPKSLIDGMWTRTDATCKEKVVFQTVTEPSEFVTVEVSVAKPRSSNISTAVSQPLPTAQQP